MKGYKGFYKGLICRGENCGVKYEKQYAENTVFDEDNAVICNKGMHFCKNPLDVLEYYPLIDDAGNFIEFAEVEALAETKTDDNKKYCTTKLKIGAKISFMDFIKGAFKVTYENIKSEVKDATKDIESGGNGAKLAGGNWAKLAGGNGATLAGGDRAKLAGGDWDTLAGGNWATLAGGYDSIIVGENGSIAKGKKGSVIVLVERDDNYHIVNFKAQQVDGEHIKEDAYYKLQNGELVEVENE